MYRSVQRRSTSLKGTLLLLQKRDAPLSAAGLYCSGYPGGPIAEGISSSSVIELSSFVYETVRTDEEFSVCRARRNGKPTFLVVAPVSKYSALETLARLEHEYALRGQLDPEWALRPLALTRHEGRRRSFLRTLMGNRLTGC